jgi:hypothetical protein
MSLLRPNRRERPSFRSPAVADPESTQPLAGRAKIPRQ